MLNYTIEVINGAPYVGLPHWEDRLRANALASVWGLKKTILSKREEIVDLELQLEQARMRVRELECIA